VEANSTGGQGSRMAVTPTDDMMMMMNSEIKLTEMQYGIIIYYSDHSIWDITKFTFERQQNYTKEYIKAFFHTFLI
jgi:hypothetical protein